MSPRARAILLLFGGLLWLGAGGLVLAAALEVTFRIRQAADAPPPSDPRYLELEAAYQPFTIQHLHPSFLFWFPLDPAARRALNNRVITLSDEGFRGSSPMEKGTRKVAFILGGSAAFGHFATRDETTISGYLNALQDQYLFVNAGVPSWVSSQELERLALELVAYQPALVIAYDGFNDAATGADYAKRGITMPPGTPESFDELSNLVDDIRGTRRATRQRLHRQLFPHLMNAVDTWREGGQPQVSQPRSPHMSEAAAGVMRTAAAAYAQNITTMSRLTSASGARFIGVFQPVLSLHAHRPVGTSCDRDRFQPELELFHQTVRARLPRDVEYHDFAALFDRDYSSVPRFCAQRGDHLVDQVFVDSVHLFDPGNKRVAEELWLRIQSGAH
jgi:hypothetical protein